MTARLERRDPGTTTDRPHPDPSGTWTIDPTHSIVAFTSRALRLWATTGRRHCSGVIHLDELPPVGVIRFQQPSGLPVLTMTLDPACPETETADLNAMLSGPDVGAVRRHRWWMLHSQSLEILPSGAWRVMATLTAYGTHGLVELCLEVDSEQSRPPGWLVLRGRGVLDRRALAIGKRASSLDPTIRLELAIHARRVKTSPTGSIMGATNRPSVTAEEPSSSRPTGELMDIHLGAVVGLSGAETESPTSRLQASITAAPTEPAVELQRGPH
jgi:YceI-like domain